MKKGMLAVFVVGALAVAWMATAGGNYVEDRRTIVVDGVKCTGLSRCYEPQRVGTSDEKVPLWQFEGEGYSQAERIIRHISISSQLIVNGNPIDSDAQEADNSSYVHSHCYGTGGDWWECVYASDHMFQVKSTPRYLHTEAGWSSKEGR